MNTINNAVCPGCTLLCDDVSFDVDGQNIRSDVQCDMAQQWMKWANVQIGATKPPHDEVEMVAANIATRLRQSKMPIVAGLASLTVQGQQAAWKIADSAGAAISNSINHRSQGSLYALQRQGKVSASLGEVANRADLLIFWFCDPAQTHPRMLERLKAKCDKTVVVIDSTKTQTAQLADHFIQVNQHDAIEVLAHARQLLSNEPNGAVSETADAPASKAVQLVKLATSCAYGCFIYGHLTTQTRDDALTLIHQKWIRQLNDHTRMVSIGLRSDCNGQSGENVLSAFSGYPVAVSQAKGIPQYYGDVWSASRLIEQRQCDFLLLFAGRSLESELTSLSKEALNNLAEIPKVVLHGGLPPKSAAFKNANMMQIAIPGASGSGDFCRLDDVLLPTTALHESPLPNDWEILGRVFEALKQNALLKQNAS